MAGAVKNHTRIRTAAILAAVFAGMLILNFWTPYAADDFNYLIHFGTKEPLRSLADVAESMYIHSLNMNGRVLSHTFAQLLGMAPKALFNVLNAALYTMLMYLIWRAAGFGHKKSPALLAMICMAFFAFLPVFGQVCLWFVGAANYLWALVWGMCFLLPFLRRYLAGDDGLKGWRFPLYCLGCVLFGSYSEITSFVCIYLAAALLVLARLLKGTPLKHRLWLGWLLACVGYCVLLVIPAERSAKQASGMDLQLLLTNFLRASAMLLRHCGLLLAVFCVLLLLALKRRGDRDRLVLSVLLLTGALGGNYMTVVASYYPARCLATSALLLLLACAMLLRPHLTGTVPRTAGGILAAVFLIQAWFGVSDIYRCHRDFLAREAVIVAAAEAGETRVTAEIVQARTPYSVFWEVRDLSTEDPTTWPNFAMGKIYGIEILGIYPE